MKISKQIFNISILTLFFIVFMLEGCGESASTISDTIPISVTLSQPTVTPPVTPFLTSISSTTNATKAQISTSLTASPSPQISQLSGWQGDWLKGIPCRLPCWEGITLGVTTPEEALSILKQSSFAIDVIQEETKIKNQSTSIHWKATGDSGKDYLASAHYEPSNHPTINHIVIELPSYRLKDVIAQFGQPTHIAATLICNDVGSISRDAYNLSFIFNTHGVAVTLISKNKPVIDDQLVIQKTEFFTPGLENISRFNFYPDKSIVPWNGFRDYTYYGYC